jgi:hypothetical protein
MTRPDRIRAAASAARDVLALLFTPVITLLVIWLVCIFAYGAWTADTQPLRLHYLGGALIGLVGLVGLGGQWFQRNRLKELKVRGPGGIGGAIETEADGPPAGLSVKSETIVETKP